MEAELRVSVRHGQQTLDISLPSSARVSDLMERLQALTNVLPRGQKLIHKGKILTPDMTLASGSKIMMMATQGTHQGSAPEMKKPSVLLKSKPAEKPATKIKPPERVEVWKSTGYVSLRDTEVLEIPATVWALGQSIIILDLTSTMLRTVPAELSCLSKLKRLSLSGNSLDDTSIHWKSLCSLQSLELLELTANCLTSLPCEIQGLSSLRLLNVSRNKLTTLPDEIGMLSRLERLNLSNNSLREIPSSIGHCSALTNVCISFSAFLFLWITYDRKQLNLSSNFLTLVPPSISELRKLKSLLVANNALKEFPASILKGCGELNSLDLHGNPITIEALREIDGWEEFDARRKAKYDKQMVFQVMGPSDGFDEGADTQETRHW
ncbi:LRR repeats and ubiquitin-like domain-containing protein At2g30105 isoform X1 [Selaginella moellendorffii]|uniref:LRR repeats and ubiquitin-like domain-containing protein At2g30105 isoform X1 n=1 Tax=Selaginella moellendorffii TaxID=88036 RepID=UPI000D1CCE1C|nr:LRR repeats and ubiquitin-like domain-containing protein At2g30105 isoform X1 [Selaginella moellendorffii]|eukprot:XP_024537594.1 LRR repeats and ubiquitin-like domain-containing protein At2g30105 isoform X1 [Selaginella moellendorffii]